MNKFDSIAQEFHDEVSADARLALIGSAVSEIGFPALRENIREHSTSGWQGTSGNFARVLSRIIHQF